MKAVYKAIAAVMGDLAKTGIAKNQTNAFDKYKFRGIDDVYNALAPLLSAHGLVILPRVLERTSEERTSQKGGAVFYVTVKAEFDFVAAEDGSSHTVCAYGEAMDRGDKGTNKAMTAAYKYAMFEAFCIPTEGSDDADAESHEVAAKAPDPEESKILADLEAAARAGPQALQMAFTAIPKSEAKARVWAAHGPRLKAMADEHRRADDNPPAPGEEEQA